MNLGVQYYRAPFPEQKHWEGDLKQIRDSGFDTVQLWVLWAWVESRPGHFDFEDYDRLTALADKNGLKVIISTIAEIHPYWIHRAVPGSEMINHLGHQVISSNRAECNFGMTPGGCTDHPGVWEHMAAFLNVTVARYRGLSVLSGWDAWNELRWNVHSDGRVCFCVPHPLGLPSLARCKIRRTRRPQPGLETPLRPVGRSDARQDADPALHRDDGLGAFPHLAREPTRAAAVSTHQGARSTPAGDGARSRARAPTPEDGNIAPPWTAATIGSTRTNSMGWVAPASRNGKGSTRRNLPCASSS